MESDKLSGGPAKWCLPRAFFTLLSKAGYSLRSQDVVEQWLYRGPAPEKHVDFPFFCFAGVRVASQCMNMRLLISFFLGKVLNGFFGTRRNTF